MGDESYLDMATALSGSGPAYVLMLTEAWIETMGVDGLPKGRDQPFYHVLVDARDRAGDQVTYVAQENMQQPDAAMGAAASEFVLSGEPLRHRLLTSLQKLWLRNNSLSGA